MTDSDFNVNDLKAGVELKVLDEVFKVREIIGVSFATLFVSVDIIAENDSHWTIHCFHDTDGKPSLTARLSNFYGGGFGDPYEPVEILKESITHSS